MRMLLTIAALSVLPVAVLAAPAWMGSYYPVGDIYAYSAQDKQTRAGISVSRLMTELQFQTNG